MFNFATQMRHLLATVLVLALWASPECALSQTARESSVRSAEAAFKTPSKKKKKKKNTRQRIPNSTSSTKRQEESVRKGFAANHLQAERLRVRSTRKKIKKEDTSLTNQSFDGSMRMEYRKFTEKSSNPDALNQNFSLLGELEWGMTGSSFDFKIWNLGRYDFNDSERSRILPYENWAAYKTENTVWKVGMQVENWSMAEVFHPSDVFNSRNFDSELENTEKIGEPSLSLRVALFDGFASFFYMPMVYSPIIPSQKSRFNALPEGVKLLEPKFYTNGELRDNMAAANQFAVRYTRSFGSVDMSAHYISQVDRLQPLIVQDISADGARPIFLPVQQVGLNGSWVNDSNIFKFDVVYRYFTEEILGGSLGRVAQLDHTIGSLGYERGFSMGDSGAESTVFLEWQQIFGVSNQKAEALSIFQNDLMLGYRLSFNDLDSRELRAMMIMDLAKSSQTLWTMSYSQKFSEKTKFTLGVRGISDFQGSTTQGVSDADHFFLNLTWFF